MNKQAKQKSSHFEVLMVLAIHRLQNSPRWSDEIGDNATVVGVR